MPGALPVARDNYCDKAPFYLGHVSVHEYSYAYMGSETTRPEGDQVVQVFFCKWCLHRVVVSADPEKGA